MPDLIQKLALWMGHQYSFVVYENPPDKLINSFSKSCVSHGRSVWFDTLSPCSVSPSEIEKLPALGIMTPQLVPGKNGGETGVQIAFMPYQRKMFGGRASGC